MKIILSTLFILSASNLQAQKNFEGTIVFQTINSKNHLKNSSTVYLKDKRAMIIAESFKKNDSLTTILYDFEKGLSYTYDEKDTVIISRALDSMAFIEKKDSAAIVQTAKILGYTCTKRIFVNPPGTIPFLEKMECWFPDKFYFETDDLKNNMLVSVITFLHNTLSFRSDFIMAPSIEKGIGNARTEAISISEVTLPSSLFVIPKHMKVMSFKEFMEYKMSKSSPATDDLEKVQR